MYYKYITYYCYLKFNFWHSTCVTTVKETSIWCERELVSHSLSILWSVPSKQNKLRIVVQLQIVWVMYNLMQLIMFTYFLSNETAVMIAVGNWWKLL